MTSALPAGSAGWDVYYVVFLSSVLALGIPLAIGALSSLLRKSAKPSFEVDHRKEAMSKARPDLIADAPLPGSGSLLPGARMNVRFFLAANAALVLITLSLILIPCVTALKETASRGLLAIVTIAGLSGLGLIYCWRKGDLSWLKTYKRET
jgi:NADH:ubiquinone oxidoreductase subunit 3 (subunit A)